VRQHLEIGRGGEIKNQKLSSSGASPWALFSGGVGVSHTSTILGVPVRYSGYCVERSVVKLISGPLILSGFLIPRYAVKSEIGKNCILTFYGGRGV